MKEGMTLDEHLAELRREIEATRIETIEQACSRWLELNHSCEEIPTDDESFRAGVAWAFRQFARLSYEWALDAEDWAREKEDYDALSWAMASTFKANADRLMEHAMGDAHWSPLPWWREREAT